MYRLALVCVSCALALTACSKPEEGSELPPLASASPSASPSPSKSAAPVDDKAAIVALARAYYAEANLAIRTGNTARLRALSLPSCPCRAFADQVDADWRRGRVDSPNYYSVLEVRNPLLRNLTAGLVTVFFRLNRYVVVDRAGKVLTSAPADATTYSHRFDARRVNGLWRVANVARL